MNIHEYQAKEILKKFGINILNGVVVFSLEEIDPTDLGTINMATGFINLYRLAEANQLINNPQEQLSRPGVVIH